MPAGRLESAAAYDFIPSHVNLVQASGAVPVDDLRVTSGFFHVFQMEPRIGHGFRPQDMAPHAPGVVVLSDATWRQRFGADPNIVGRAIILGNQQYTVIGVADPKFRLDAKVDVWTPLPDRRITKRPSQQLQLRCADEARCDTGAELKMT